MAPVESKPAEPTPPAALEGIIQEVGTDFAMSIDDGQLSKVVTFDGAVQFGLPGPEDTIVNAVIVAQGQISKAMPDLPPTAPKASPKEELDKLDHEFIPESQAKMEPASSGMDSAKALNWLRNGNIRYVKNHLRKDGGSQKRHPALGQKTTATLDHLVL